MMMLAFSLSCVACLSSNSKPQSAVEWRGDDMRETGKEEALVLESTAALEIEIDDGG